MANGAPGGALREFAKWGAEQLLWRRVAVQRVVEQRSGRANSRPEVTEPTGVLSTRADWEHACTQLRALKLPAMLLV